MEALAARQYRVVMRVTPAQERLVAHWVDTGYRELNSALRSGEPLTDPVLVRDAASLTGLIARSELPRGTVLYRGALAPTKRGESYTQAKVGAQLVLDAGFASASTSRAVASNFPEPRQGPEHQGEPSRPEIQFELTAAVDGLHALDIDAIRQHVGFDDEGEDEWLLPPNTVIVVQSVTRLPGTYSRKLVKAEIVETPV